MRVRVPLHSPAISLILGELVGLWTSTYRLAVWNREWEDRLKGEGKRIIYVFWHNRLLSLIAYYRRAYLTRFKGGRVDVLVSKSKDGELMARVLHRFQFGTVRGSSSRGGREAMLEMVKKLNKGIDIGIIPDGPRGPRYVAKMGAVALARATGSPLLPVGVSAKPVLRFNSWDEFILPLPFARVGIYFGEPLYVSREDDLERARRALEEALMGATIEADERIGVRPDW